MTPRGVPVPTRMGKITAHRIAASNRSCDVCLSSIPKGNSYYRVVKDVIRNGDKTRITLICCFHCKSLV